MDEVELLIRQFKEERTESLADIDDSRKASIIEKLEGRADERVLKFFLEVLSDENEYDLARIEVLKILELKERGDEARDEEIGQLIKQILLADPDDDVRTYAALAASNYLDVDGMLEAVVKILFDTAEDMNIRWNAFATIKKLGPKPQAIEIMTKAMQEPAFQKSAFRILEDWKTGSG